MEKNDGAEEVKISGDVNMEIWTMESAWEFLCLRAHAARKRFEDDANFGRCLFN